MSVSSSLSILRMARDATIRRVEARVPNSLVPTAAEEPTAFERVWERLPASEQENVFTFVEEDGGLFVKGQQPMRRGRPTPARRRRRILNEVRSLRRLAELELPVPELVAWGVEEDHGVVQRSFLVLRQIPEAVSLDEFLSSATVTAATRAGVLSQVGGVVRRLHECSVFHRDLSARNLMVQQGAGGHCAVWIIDCPRAEESRLPLRRGFLRRADLYRLARSLLKVGATDDEVLTTLAAAGAPPALRTALRRHVAASLDSGASRPWRANLWLMLGL